MLTRWNPKLGIHSSVNGVIVHMCVPCARIREENIHPYVVVQIVRQRTFSVIYLLRTPQLQNVHCICGHVCTKLGVQKYLVLYPGRIIMSNRHPRVLIITITYFNRLAFLIHVNYVEMEVMPTIILCP